MIPMKKCKKISRHFVLIIILLLMLSIAGCSSGVSEEAKAEIEADVAKQYEDTIKGYEDEILKLEKENDKLSSEVKKTEEYEKTIKSLEDELTAATEKSAQSAATPDIIIIPEYTGDASVVINNGVPFFTEDDLKITGESYSDLDEKGRCGVCIALVGQDTMPKEPRESIGDIKPSGWDTVKYDGIDGNYLYNRCHLIGWQLTGENANTKNLITGTRYLNTQGMEPIESTVANYVQSTGNPVLYRATPIFAGDNLLASGVLIEALSIEDDAIKINSFCYNIQPDVTIDYATGKSDGPAFTGTETEESAESEAVRQQDESTAEAEPKQPATEEAAAAAAAAAAVAAATEEPRSETEATEDTEANSEEEEKVVTYVGNANSHKFHRPGCSSVGDMAEHNKVFFYGDRQEALDRNFVPCKKCNP